MSADARSLSAQGLASSPNALREHRFVLALIGVS
jgi:hypothetical protein